MLKIRLLYRPGRIGVPIDARCAEDLREGTGELFRLGRSHATAGVLCTDCVREGGVEVYLSHIGPENQPAPKLPAPIFQMRIYIFMSTPECTARRSGNPVKRASILRR